jgi:hypothetical protein
MSSSFQYRWEAPATAANDADLPAHTAPINIDLDELLQEISLQRRQEDVRDAVRSALDTQPFSSIHPIHSSGIAVLSALSDVDLERLRDGSVHTIEVAMLTAVTATEYVQLFFSDAGDAATLGETALQTSDAATAEAVAAAIQLNVWDSSPPNLQPWRVESVTQIDAVQEQRTWPEIRAKVSRAIASWLPEIAASGNARFKTQRAMIRAHVDFTKQTGQKGSYIFFSLERDSRVSLPTTPVVQRDEKGPDDEANRDAGSPEEGP